MNVRRSGISDIKLMLAAGVAACGIMGGAAGLAKAQETAPAQQPVQIDIAAGNLADALIQLGRDAKVQIGFLPDRVTGMKSPAVRGAMTVEQALTRLLEKSGLNFQKVSAGSYVVSGPSKANLTKARRLASDIAAGNGYVNGQSSIPDILVTGRRDWTLNTDIRRTENEAQPYRVFTREQIQNSGSQSLDDFLRDNLGQLTTVRTAAQGGGVNGRDTYLSLRGMGAESTLILVDGRRYAQPNNGIAGTFVQSSIAGIPLEQIERVEVLASSAAGQYGSNAVGGVINIILRRDYHGIEIGGYLGGSTRGDAMERRLSASATLPVLPKTSVTLTGSWRKSDPLFSRDRPFVNDRLDVIRANDPAYLGTTESNVYGTTPNIRALNRENLVLDDQYAVNGVTALGSNRTYIPVGYRGVAIDGAAALLANAGEQNFNPSPGSSAGLNYGDRARLLGASEVLNGSAAVRSELNNWLTLYGSGSYSKVMSNYEVSLVQDAIDLPGTSPVNPFTTAIRVTFPSDGPYGMRHSQSETWQFLGGAIAKLPWNWQANFDVNTSWSKSSSDEGREILATDFFNTYIRGTMLDVLRDTLAYPIDWQFADDGSYSGRRPSKASQTSYTLKLAGPLGFARLWGGTPVVTLMAETQRQWLGNNLSVTDSPARSTLAFSPERSLNTKSVYGELVLPIIGADNHVPLVHEFELRLSGRYDAYKGRGTSTTIQCLSHEGRLTEAERATPCPPPTMIIPYETVRNDTANPVIAARWAVTPDIAFRGSFSTGYTPPQLNNVLPMPGLNLAGYPSALAVTATDPLRGNERFGEDRALGVHIINAVTGGNPNVDPQRSRSWSFGTILTPRFLPGLTLRADWTRITIRNAYFDPRYLLISTTPEDRIALGDFMAAYPERFERAPAAPGDPFGVGRVVYIDATTANLSLRTSEAIDFSGSYNTQLARLIHQKCPEGLAGVA